MGRKRRYANPAERQRAYRERLAKARRAPARKRARPPSRPKRLASIEEAVRSLLDEYQEWRDSLPDGLADSEQAARLDDTIESLDTVAHILGDIEPPLGFGRD